MTVETIPAQGGLTSIARLIRNDCIVVILLTLNNRPIRLTKLEFFLFSIFQPIGIMLLIFVHAER